MNQMLCSALSLDTAEMHLLYYSRKTLVDPINNYCNARQQLTVMCQGMWQGKANCCERTCSSSDTICLYFSQL